ncbi:MAG TPA: N-acetylmuramoyl-L-alanine amidase [Chloroflexia bacterium]|nr:N-acetylmuramoyl-L-alanine amidase [Chloroflexia bacterium]
MSAAPRPCLLAVALATLLLGACALSAMQPVHAAVVNPAVVQSGPFHVGLQAGHWKIAQLPAELARLRTSTGTSAGGRSEVDLNLDIARRAATLLRAEGVVVDVLPATVPTGYRADAFVAIHADGNNSTRPRGFKIATRWRSAGAFRDQALVDLLDTAYSAATGLPHDGAVTRNMRGYYAMNTWLGTDSRISSATPAAIIETGYMTNAADRAVLFRQTGTVAAGIARGVLDYLHRGPAADRAQARADAVAAASPTGWSVAVVANRAAVRTGKAAGAPVAGYVSRGDSLAYLDNTARPKGPFTNAQLHGSELASSSAPVRVSYPGSTNPLYISRDAIIIQQPLR